MFTWIYGWFTCLAAEERSEEPAPEKGEEKTVEGETSMGLSAIFAEEQVILKKAVVESKEIPWSELVKLHQVPRDTDNVWPPKPHLGRRISMMKDQWETMINGKDWEEYNAALKRGPGQERIQKLKEQLAINL